MEAFVSSAPTSLLAILGLNTNEGFIGIHPLGGRFYASTDLKALIATGAQDIAAFKYSFDRITLTSIRLPVA